MSKVPDLVYEKCSILIQELKFEEGLKYCIEQMKDYPEDPLLWYLKGSFYQGLEKPKESIACFDESIKRDPNHWPPYLSKAQSLYGLGNVDEGIKNLEIAIGKDEKNIRALIYMALFYVTKNNMDKAKDYFRKAIDIDSNTTFVEFRNLEKAIMSSPKFPAEKMAEVYKTIADFKKALTKLKKK